MKRKGFTMKGIWTMILLAILLSQASAQHLALKENLPYDALRIPNLGVELALCRNWTVDLWGAYNPFQESETRKWKIWTIQPELRYWLCKNFSGTFVGIHSGAGQYNMGGFGTTLDLGTLGTLDLDGLKEHRVQGAFWDAGLSVGQHWILSPHWGLEATLGFGYGHYQYKRFRCLHCGEQTTSGTKNYLGPTRAGISLVYLIH